MDKQKRNEQRRGLKFGVYEGIAGTVMLTIVTSFLAVYALALGASNTVIGIVVSLPVGLAVLGYLPAAYITERSKSRKKICFVSSLVSRIWWIPISMIPFLISEQSLWIPLLLVMLSIYAFAGAFVRPAWASIMGDMISMGRRGEYFGKRNRYTALFSLIAVIFAGVALDMFNGMEGFFIVFLIAGIAGTASSFLFRGFPDIKTRTRKVNITREVREMMRNRTFRIFTLVFIVWNFGVHMSSPFVSVYIVENLGAVYTWISILVIIKGITTVIIQRWWGKVSDMFGHRSILIISAIATSSIPFMWFMVSPGDYWIIVLIGIVSGVAWAGFNLASFNYFLDISEGKRTMYNAVFSTLSEIPLFIAPAVSGFFMDYISIFDNLPFNEFRIMFLISGSLRLFAGVLFLFFLIEVPTRVRLSTANVTSELMSMGYHSMAGSFYLLGRNSFYTTKKSVRFLMDYVNYSVNELKSINIKIPKNIRLDLRRTDREMRKYKWTDHEKLRVLEKRMTNNLLRLNRMKMRSGVNNLHEKLMQRAKSTRGRKK